MFMYQLRVAARLTTMQSKFGASLNSCSAAKADRSAHRLWCAPAIGLGTRKTLGQPSVDFANMSFSRCEAV